MKIRNEITDLTACRALFAAWVFIYHVDLHAQFAHFLGPAADLVRRGYLGVDGFFILSGLLLMRLHKEFGKNFAPTWRFWGKRLARVYPVHLAVIVLLGVFVLTGAAMGVAPRDPARFGLRALLENLLLIQGWGFANPWSWNYPSWAVSAEWAGYLAFPLLAMQLIRQPTIVVGQIVLVCMPLLGILVVASGHGLNVASGFPLLARFFLEFVIGMGSALLVPVFADNLPTAACVLFGLVVLLGSVLLGWDFFAALGLWLTLMSLTMHADADRKPLLRALPWLRPLGLLSYAFYMSFATAELLLAQAFRREAWDPAAHALLYSTLMTGLTFAIALVLYVLVENPCRSLADRWLAKPAPTPARAVPGRPVPGSRRGGPGG